MLFLHETHSVAPEQAAGLEALLRDRWLPALGRQDGVRLIWAARSMPGSPVFPELVTLTAIRDHSALEALGERIRSGDLRQDALELDGARQQVAQRITTPLSYSPFADRVDFTMAPVARTDAPGEIYIHDFVDPQPGMQRAYEAAMKQSYFKMLEAQNLDKLMWASLETVIGGGPHPECIMITHCGTAEGVTNLFWRGTAEPAKPGSWMYEALKVRDTWISRLVRSVPWSPIV